MKSNRDGDRTLAVFIDFENVGLGFGNRRDRFSIEKVLERLVEKGKIVAKKAYADWSRFGNYASSLHASAVELVEIPKRAQTGKNSADIRMCVDAMDLAYSKDHIDTFVVVSGDSDFSPLVSKLKELGKHVIGLGLADSTSELLRDNCDEFIYYEDLDRVDAAPLVETTGVPEIKRKAFQLLIDSLLALRRENKEVMYSSMVKDTMKRKKPSFNEEYHGYRTFSDLLEDAAKQGIIDLDRHKASGMYIITRFGDEPKGAGPAAEGGRRSGAIRVAEPGPKPPAAVDAPAAAPAPPRREPRAEAKPDARPEPRREPRAEPTERRRVERPAAPAAARETPPPAPKPPARPAADPLPEPLPLGRGLLDEVDDDLDAVPSYHSPRKSPPAKEPAAKPAGKTTARPAGGGRSAKPAAEKKPRESAKPAAKSAGGRAAKPAEPKAEARPRPAAAPVPAPAPKPAEPADGDDFGAGLDL